PVHGRHRRHGRRRRSGQRRLHRYRAGQHPGRLRGRPGRRRAGDLPGPADRRGHPLLTGGPRGARGQMTRSPGPHPHAAPGQPFTQHEEERPDMRNGIRSHRFLAAGAAAAAITLLAGACGGGGGGVATGPEEGEGGGQEISIAMIPWEEDIAVTNLWKVILEEKGYSVTIEEVDVAPTFQGVANGDIDMYLDVWLPTTHGDYWDQYGEQLEDLGAWNEGASLELTVPSYVEDVNSIADLADNADLFDSRIVGIEAGSGLVQQTENEAIPTYGLDDYELVKSSTPAMLE